MTALLASVQTTDDAALPSLTVCLLILAASAIVTACIFAPTILAEWRRAGRVIDDMPLPAEPTVPRQLTRANSSDRGESR